MNRRSFLKYAGASVAAAIISLPALGKPSKVFKVPQIMLLQPLSPEVAERAAARAGMLMDVETRKLYDSIEFVPCNTKHFYTEWKDRTGGGFIGTHKWDSEIVKTAKNTSTEFLRYTTPSGNQLVETYCLYGLMVRGDKVVTPCVLSFTGAKIKIYKNFLSVVMRANTRPPLFAFRLRISTVIETNRVGTFYNYRIEPAKGHWTIMEDWSVEVTDSLIRPDHPLVGAARKLRDQIA